MATLGRENSRKARTGSARRLMTFSRRVISVGLVMGFCLAVSISNAAAQSGRQKGSKSKPNTPKQRPGPIAEPARNSATSVKDTTAKKDPDQVDPGDVVRITSNLVPIPASIFDQRGVAVTG